ncbi:WD40/YVTN repeat-like-containing domain [Lasallia pustulata]|uniref:WD40/YVTN repeat-like-containing domain n=1 Tax=Lasallia pustulata TaxID=136370 RepID=A0A1W5CXQ7_9LECA|nr:WD40/YVTN repeat-like-containing domain [Lasallia pustulata]
METAIRWSPSSSLSEQRFLIADVVGRTFKLCKVNSYDGGNLQYQKVATHNKVPHFRAFDWSPFDESLLAVGQWTGEATILRIDESSQDTLSLPIKHQRLCNAVAFSTNGLLATGLERVRNDFCLNVFDINQRLGTNSTKAFGSGRQPVEPMRKLASSEVITSIKFFTDQPDALVTGVKGSCLRIYDVRETTGSPSLQFQTRCVHNLAIDPLDENYFASASPQGEATVNVWDRRSGSRLTAASLGSGAKSDVQDGSVLELKDVVDSTGSIIWSLRYSKSRRGCLGILASTGQYKVFDVAKQYVSGEEHAKKERGEVGSEQDQVYVKSIQHVAYPYYDHRYGSEENRRIVSFDFTNLAGAKGTPCAIILRGDKAVGICELRGHPPPLAVSSRSSLVVGETRASNRFEKQTGEDDVVSKAFRVITPKENGDIGEARDPVCTETAADDSIELHAFYSGTRDVAGVPPGESYMSSRKAHEKLYDLDPAGSRLSMDDALAFSTIPRRRCADGYLFDCDKNARIVGHDRWLKDMWTWIGHNGMVAGMLDLAYVGVYGIWYEDLGSGQVARQRTHVGMDVNVASTIKELCKQLQLPEFEGVDTDFPELRQLCLYTCGLGMPYSELEATVKDLVSHGHHTKAAALAIIHDKIKLAFQALRNGNATPAHRLLSLGLAGFVKGETDDTWDETVKDIAKELHDPYARAILALVGDGDWHDVLGEASLPLRDRVGVALMYLSDKELTGFIGNATTEAIKHGDIEGIVLTGLTEKGMDLFQRFIQRFDDLQTAVLAMSFTVPRYITDVRFESWREAYRSSMNSWKLFLHRAHFDAQSTKLSTTWDGRTLNQPVPRQVTLRCNHCDQALDRNKGNIDKNAR